MNNEKYKVLIVDDSPVMAKLTAKNVESLGYDAAVRASSTLAFSYVGNNKTDLILMDIELIGSRYDGIRTAKAIRAKYSIPVIFITGHDDAKIFEEADIKNSFDVIMKPYDLKNLKMQIEVAIYNNRIEKKMRENEIWLVQTLAMVSDCIILLDPGNTIISYSQATVALLGLKSEKLAGLNITDVIKLARPGNNTSAMVETDYMKSLLKVNNLKLVLLSDRDADIPVRVVLKKVINPDNTEAGKILMLTALTGR